MKKLAKRASDFIDSVGENESAVIMVSDGNNDFFYGNFASVVDIAAGIATILSDYLDDERPQASTIGKGIVLGITQYIKNGGNAIKLAGKIAQACTERMKSDVKKIIEDDKERCEDCKANRVCPLPKAIEYRKENKIPAPKRARKNGKKSDGKCN